MFLINLITDIYSNCRVKCLKLFRVYFTSETRIFFRLMAAFLKNALKNIAKLFFFLTQKIRLYKTKKGAFDDFLKN